MVKFKLGDKVRILDGSKIKNYTYNWSEDMNKEIGEVATIRTIMTSEKYNSYKLNGHTYYFDERWLELVEEMKEEIKIKRYGNTVVATYGKFKGVARCCPEDEFNLLEGAKIALERLEEEKRGVELYNGKVVCVDVRNNKMLYTKGKIYQFENGRMIADNGLSYPDTFHECKSFKDWKEWTSAKFIEVVE